MRVLVAPTALCAVCFTKPITFVVVVGAPPYFKRWPQPKKPQDLTAHDCINIRLPTYGGIYIWEFEKRGRELKVRVDGQLVFNNLALRLNAALAGAASRICPKTRCGPTSLKED